MISELVMGFDGREMWMPTAEVANWEDKHWLLNPNVERVMSVNRAIWQSVFLPPGGKHRLAAEYQTAPGYNLTIPDESSTLHNFWHDLDAMRNFMRDHKDEFQKRCWMIAITIVQTLEYLRGLAGYGMSVPPTEEIQPNRQWTLLGYDVEDSRYFNGGLGMSWTEEYESERRKLWGHRLNQYYLFSNQGEAVEYVDWHLSMSPGIGRLLVFGLYFIQEMP